MIKDTNMAFVNYKFLIDMPLKEADKTWYKFPDLINPTHLHRGLRYQTGWKDSFNLLLPAHNQIFSSIVSTPTSLVMTEKRL